MNELSFQVMTRTKNRVPSNTVKQYEMGRWLYFHAVLNTEIIDLRLMVTPISYQFALFHMCIINNY